MQDIQLTCLQQPLKGSSDGGLCRQVVLIQRCISITEVAHGAAYSGHYRQVVFTLAALAKGGGGGNNFQSHVRIFPTTRQIASHSRTTVVESCRCGEL